MNDIATVAAALADVGTIGILIAFIYAIWKDHQLLSERLYQITVKLMERVLNEEPPEGKTE